MVSYMCFSYASINFGTHGFSCPVEEGTHTINEKPYLIANLLFGGERWDQRYHSTAVPQIFYGTGLSFLFSNVRIFKNVFNMILKIVYCEMVHTVSIFDFAIAWIQKHFYGSDEKRQNVKSYCKF